MNQYPDNNFKKFSKSMKDPIRTLFTGPNISSIQFIHNIDMCFPNAKKTLLVYIFPLLISNRLYHVSLDKLYQCDYNLVVGVLSLYIGCCTTNTLCYLMDLRRFVLQESSNTEWADFVGVASKQFICFFCESIITTNTSEVFIPHHIKAQVKSYASAIVSVMETINFFTSWIKIMVWKYETMFHRDSSYMDLSTGADSDCVELILHLFHKYTQGIIESSFHNLIADSNGNGTQFITITSGLKRRKLMGDSFEIQCHDGYNVISVENCSICSNVFRQSFKTNDNPLVVFCDREAYVISLCLYNLLVTNWGGKLIWDSRLIKNYNVYNRVNFGVDPCKSITQKISTINKLSRLSTYHQNRLNIFGHNSGAALHTSLESVLGKLSMDAFNMGFKKFNSVTTETTNNIKGKKTAHLNIIDKNKVITLKLVSTNSKLLPLFDEKRLSEKQGFVSHSNSVLLPPVNCTFSRYKVRNARFCNGNINTYNLNISGNKLDIILAIKVMEINTQKIYRRCMYSHTISSFLVRNNCSTVDIGGVLNEFAFRHRYRMCEQNLLNGSRERLKAIETTCFPAYNTFTQLNNTEICGDYNISMRDKLVVDTKDNLIFEMQIHRKNLNTSKLYGMELQTCVTREMTHLLNSQDVHGRQIVEFNVELHNLKASVERRSTNLISKAVNLFIELYYLFCDKTQSHKQEMLKTLFVSRDMICTYGQFSYVNNYGNLFRKESLHFISSKYHLQDVIQHFAIDQNMILSLYEKYPFDLGVLHKYIMRYKNGPSNKHNNMIHFLDSRTTGILGYIIFGSKDFIKCHFETLISHIRKKTQKDCTEYLHMLNLLCCYLNK